MGGWVYGDGGEPVTKPHEEIWYAHVEGVAPGSGGFRTHAPGCNVEAKLIDADTGWEIALFHTDSRAQLAAQAPALAWAVRALLNEEHTTKLKERALEILRDAGVM